MTRMLFRGALGAAACLALPHLACAHAVLERRQASPGSMYRGVVQIMHGCEGSPTVEVKVTVPEGMIGARPMPKAGWTLSSVKGRYVRSYAGMHGTLSEGVREITWSGGSVPADAFDEFVFVAEVSDALAPGQTVHVPILQTCQAGSVNWAEIPGAGQDAHALKAPAPAVHIVAAADQASGTMAGMHDMAGMAGKAHTAGTAPVQAGATYKLGALTIERPWLRATPGGAKVAGGYLRITNAGTEPDRLIAAAIPLAQRGEVHEMSMTNGVMHMAPVEGGLEIQPGQSVELKPGGYHIMFMDLHGGLTEGETIKGTLTFAKAGTVEVAFRVEGLGARGPEPAHRH